MSEEQLREIKSKFEGNWKCDRTENLDDFLKEMGINFMIRKLASLATPTSEIKVEGSTIHVSFNAGFMKKAEAFILGEEVETEFLGEKMKVTLSYTDGKMVTASKEGDGNLKAQRTTRQIIGEELYMEMQTGDVVCKRYFKRI